MNSREACPKTERRSLLRKVSLSIGELAAARCATMGAARTEAVPTSSDDREAELFVEHGFERTITQIARFEGALGINDLARFTAP